MPPFLQLHALAATRGDGLRPELRVLFERQAKALQAASNVAVAIADGQHLISPTVDRDRTVSGIIDFSSEMTSDRDTVAKRNHER